jgi:cytoskeletal protein RodZ
MNPTPEKTKSGRGCFLYGCLSLVVLFILVVALGIWGIRHYIGSAIEQFTEATPQQFEPAALPEAESQALQERLQNFARDLQQTNQAAQLALDSRELNAVIAAEPSSKTTKCAASSACHSIRLPNCRWSDGCFSAGLRAAT